MTELKQAKLQVKIQEILEFAKKKQVYISAVQEITPQGRIQCVPLYTDLEAYEDEPKITDVKTTSDTTGTE